MTLAEKYKIRYDSELMVLCPRLEQDLHSFIKSERIDQISVRAKEVDSFIAKAATTIAGAPKYVNPLAEIQDQIGARVVTYFLSDVDRISEALKKAYGEIEEKTIVPDSTSEFGYFGRHFIFMIPSDVLLGMDSSVVFFELQVKTLFQHAWSQANHDLGYKQEVPTKSEQQRLIAYSSAQAWGADQVFQRLHTELAKT